MSLPLPRFVVLKSKYNSKYLRYIHENVEVHGFLQFSGEEIVSPLSKLEVVEAGCGNGLVHLRCSYNNKFLTRWTQTQWWIVAGADHPEEDQSKWSCTLFKPIFVDGEPQNLRFMHVQLGHYACLWRDHEPYASCLYAGAAHIDKDECDVFTFIDWESMMAQWVNSVKIEAWGGLEGQSWSFEVEGGGISKIIIRTGEVVDQLAFVGKTVDGKVQQSANFGGTGGHQSEIVLDWPREYVTSITGIHAFGPYYRTHVIRWLEFTTNLGTKHGPYGDANGVGTPFSLTVERGAVVGFHGRTGGGLVGAIGIYVRPIGTPKP